MLKLYVVRHGQTEFNLENRMQGRIDSPLTPKGRADAEALGRHLSDVNFDLVLASPSKRAQTTAELICKDRDINVQVEKDIREINMGSWEGRTKAEILKAFPEAGDIFFNKPHLYKALEGDSYYDVQDRAVSAVKRLAEQYKDGNILMVTHTVVIRAIIAYFKGFSMENLWKGPAIEGTSVTLLKAENGKITVTSVGETPHML